MAKKQFKAESKRLLDLMIHSIYTHKEIFLRELISNASDAIDKLYYRALTENITGLSREDFAIDLEADKENRVLTIEDNGCGMTREELENNLGTIAKSGSFAFKGNEEVKEAQDISIIGQFGVGFYSAFMVSSRVTVISRAYNAEQAYRWESTGADGYTVTEDTMEGHGTKVILHLLENNSEQEENYDEFLDGYRLKALVKKYSDYIRYPIRMEMEKSRPAEGKEGEYETYTELETLNSMVPLWRKNKNEITPEEYNQFYKEKFYDYEDPLRVIHIAAEGAATYNALLFIPGKASFGYYSKDFEKGLQLYANGVLIMEKCADLLPDCFSFVKGLVDSQDLQLNISREMLQHDRQLKLIESRLEKRIKTELLSMLQNEREKYETFYKAFGLQLKYGVYADYGMKRDLLQDLLLFYSSGQKKLVTLGEYVAAMKEGQKYIYYASGQSVERIDQLPQTELLKDRGYEILYLTDDVDEFALRVLNEYEGKAFRSIAGGDLGLEEAEDKAEAEKEQNEHQALLDFMAEALAGKVKKVALSKRLKSHPVCLSTEGALSLEMEKVLNAMPNDNKVAAERVLELNAAHPLFEKLQQLFAGGEDQKETLKTYADLLYDQALLLEGMQVENPSAFADAVCKLMTRD